MPLARATHVISGLTMGRKLTGEIQKLPYLRVANVQAGFLNLTEVKEIEANAQEARDYELATGDILFTEGGDRDKLGRGAVWEEQVSGCLFQNHIHRARLQTELLLPHFVSMASNPPDARDYFMSVAKQTVNLASLNSTNLKEWPIPLPSVAEQREVVSELQSMFCEAEAVKATATASLANLRRLEESVLQTAFRGEL